MRNKALVAEFVGTLVLVFVGVGAAVLAGDVAGGLGIAVAFGLVLTGLIYALGPVSGGHFNPAVTIGMVISGRMRWAVAVGYWIAQVIGAIVGAALLFLVLHLGPTVSTHGAFGTNGYGDRSQLHTDAVGALLVEILLTALFVFVILAVTGRRGAPNLAGLVIGLTLLMLHMVGLPLTGLSVNPARSIGPALFAAGGALTQLWVFIVAPMVGGALAAVLHTVFEKD
ncbi:MAG TPA: aquaporin [Mycobacteriales bacterium]